MTATEKVHFWQQQITDWEATGLSGNAYCKQQSLIYHQFVYWRQKLTLSLPQIYLYRAPVDFRKQANSLAVLVEQELGHNPFTGALYAFTNRQRNKIKCLMWEDNGFVLYYKALAEEKFKWPKASDELMLLTGEQINWLLDGYDIALLKGHKTLHYEAVN